MHKHTSPDKRQVNTNVNINLYLQTNKCPFHLKRELISKVNICIKKQIQEGQMPDHYLNMKKTALSSLDKKIKR